MIRRPHRVLLTAALHVESSASLVGQGLHAVRLSQLGLGLRQGLSGGSLVLPDASLVLA